jgi:hypothetical protein
MSEEKSMLWLGESVQREIAYSLFSVVALISTASPVAASHGDCSTPEALAPLIDLLHSLGDLAFVGGVTIGTIGFLLAGTFLMIPGQDWTRRARGTAKNVFIGVILLLSADMIVGYLIAQLGGC